MNEQNGLFEVCDSCHLRMAECLIYFDDNGPTFWVCGRCAQAAEGHYGKIVQAPDLGGDAA